MTSDAGSNIISARQDELLAAWLRTLQSSGVSTDRRTSVAQIEQEAREFVRLLAECTSAGYTADIAAPNWMPLRNFLEEFSRRRAAQGFTADVTASYIFSFKKALFEVQNAVDGGGKSLIDLMWKWTEIVDALGLHTISTYQKSREEVIRRQQDDLLELSTPVIKLWEGVLALPMIGTLDSSRTQVVMETLLQRIVDTGSSIAILDITGVPTVDTLVAQHLMKTVTAIRLMGADCIISGIRPQIAQTIVHLGIDLTGITTKANLADALAVAMQRTNALSAN
ncbi:MAG TPA: STAS domain-containing protein [Rudaea sp.]|jgi:rsbT co-antagonist protein RsbR|nr:STAS domain-containing protein [Rudaea sp.]